MVLPFQNIRTCSKKFHMTKRFGYRLGIAKIVKKSQLVFELSRKKPEG